MNAPYSRGDILGLLVHFGWERRAGVEDRYAVWVAPDNLTDAVVPLNPQAGDYEALLARVGATLSRRYGAEAASQLEALRLITESSLDTTRWRKETTIVAGVIPWEAGEALFESARQQLVAAAKSTLKPRRYHGNASSPVAKKFLERALMGQTSVGSYIVNAHIPEREVFYSSLADAKRAEQSPGIMLDNLVSATGAQIIDTLEKALRTSRALLDTYATRPELDQFVEAVPDGISYEFVKALASVSGDGDLTVEIRRPGSDDAPPSVARIAFESSDNSVLSSAANLLAQTAEPRSVTLTGEVTLLSRSESEGGGERVIRLDVHDGAEVRKARVPLTEAEYEVALEAHRERKDVTISGRLEKEGQNYWLYGANGIEYAASPPTDSVDDLFTSD